MTDGTVAAISDTPLGFRHGPKTFITADTLVFVMVSSDPYTRRYDLDLLNELRTDGRAGRVIAITASDGERGECLQVDGASDAALCFPYLACGQLYALHRSLILGHTAGSAEPIRNGQSRRARRNDSPY